MRSPSTLAVEPGSIFGFRTSPAFPDSPPLTGRYGTFVVLAHNRNIVALAALDGVWESMPTLAEAQGSPLLRSNRFAARNRIASVGCDPKDEPTLAEFTLLGEAPLTDEQRKLGAKYLGDNPFGLPFSSAEKVGTDVEHEWRWAHDRDAYLREYELNRQRDEQQRLAAQHRYETRLKGLTWEQLLSETPFERWDQSPPFPPAEFRDAAASRVLQACRELAELGPKPRKAAARTALKALVSWLNEADARAGGVIETEEREDIYLVLEEIAHGAGHPSLVEEAAGWATW